MQDRDTGAGSDDSAFSPSGPGESSTPASTSESLSPIDQLATFLDHVLVPGAVTELRILGYGREPKDTAVGWFDAKHRNRMARIAISESKRANGVYFIPNPIDPSLLDRSPNAIRGAEPKKFKQTEDADIMARRYVVVDIDPVRAADTNATDEEKLAAVAVADQVRRFFAEQSWPPPCVVDSGNGTHLYYPIADLVLPVGDEYKKRGKDRDELKDLLNLLSRFDSKAAKIDTKVYNPARILKLPFTHVRKGPKSKDRPHRVAELLEMPTVEQWEHRLTRTQFESTLEVLRKTTKQDGKANGKGKAKATIVVDGEELPADVVDISSPGSGSGSGNGAGGGGRPRPSNQDRAIAYLAKMSPSISGNGGHNALLDAARAVVYGFDLGVEVGHLLLMEHFNPRCQPPWEESDVRRKCEEVDRLPFGKPRGWIVADAPEIHRGSTSRPSDPDPDSSRSGDRRFEPGYPIVANYRTEYDGDKAKTIGLSVNQITSQLVDATDGWPKRVGDILFSPNHSGDGINFIKDQASLFAWMSGELSGRFHRSDNPIDWRKPTGTILEKSTFFAHLVATAESFRSVELHPHWPPLPETYYFCPDAGSIPKSSGDSLFGLMKMLRPASSEDYDLLMSLLMTVVWGGLPGKRPAFLIESSADREGGRGAGKSTIAQIVAKLVGGSIGMSQNEQPRDLFTRLLTPTSLTKRVVIIDNIKSTHFSSCDIERLITDEEINGRQLFIGDGCRPNYLTWIFTCNQPSLSKDLAQRCVTIRVTRPIYDPEWTESIDTYLNQNRWGIISDLINRLRSETPPFVRQDRWSYWLNRVLGKTAEPDKAYVEIESRRKAVDEDDAIGAEVERAIFEWMQKENPIELNWDRKKVFMLSRDLVPVLKDYAPHAGNISRFSGWLKTINMKHVRYARYQGARGFLWTGENSDESTRVHDVNGRTIYDPKKNGTTGDAGDATGDATGDARSIDLDKI